MHAYAASSFFSPPHPPPKEVALKMEFLKIARKREGQAPVGAVRDLSAPATGVPPGSGKLAVQAAFGGKGGAWNQAGGKRAPPFGQAPHPAPAAETCNSVTAARKDLLKVQKTRVQSLGDGVPRPSAIRPWPAQYFLGSAAASSELNRFHLLSREGRGWPGAQAQRFFHSSVTGFGAAGSC